MKKFTKKELDKTIVTLESLLTKCEKSLTILMVGTSQHSLLINRVEALKIALELINKELEK